MCKECPQKYGAEIVARKGGRRVTVFYTVERIAQDRAGRFSQERPGPSSWAMEG